MIAIAGALVLIGVLVVWRVECFARDRAAERRADEQSRERDVTIRESEAKPADPPLPELHEFPRQLQGFVERESEQFARDDATLVVHEEFVNAGRDWDRAAARLAHRFNLTDQVR